MVVQKREISGGENKPSNRVRGTNDFWPIEVLNYLTTPDDQSILNGEIFSHIEQSFFQVGERYGFQRFRTPLLEERAIFERTLGEQVRKEMFTATRYRHCRQDDPVLRPEATASVMRAVIDRFGNHKAFERNLRLAYAGPMFRYERPQTGRFRQFHQVGAEFMNTPTTDPQMTGWHEAEVIGFGAAFLSALGIPSTAYQLSLNSLGCQETLQSYTNILREYLVQVEDELSPFSQERVRRGNYLRVLDSSNPIDAPIIEQAPIISDYYSDADKERFDTICQHLEALQINYQLEPTLVRGLDYYRHTIFEFKLNPTAFETVPLGPSQSTLLAGGRYDQLATMMGHRHGIDAVGFAAGIERLAMVTHTLQESLCSNQASNPILGIVVVREEDKKLTRALDSYALELLNRVRQSDALSNWKIHGVNNSGTIPTQIRKLMKKYPDQERPLYAIIIGKQELENNQLGFKDLRAAKQMTLDRDKLVEHLLKN